MLFLFVLSNSLHRKLAPIDALSFRFQLEMHFFSPSSRSLVLFLFSQYHATIAGLIIFNYCVFAFFSLKIMLIIASRAPLFSLRLKINLFIYDIYNIIKILSGVKTQNDLLPWEPPPHDPFAILKDKGHPFST